MGCQDENEPNIAWIDYLVASRAPGDKALLEEHLAQSWEYSEIMKAMMRDGPTSEMFETLQAQMRRSELVQERIFMRGRELQAAGAKPADEATTLAWQNLRLSLASVRPRDREDEYRA